MKCKFVIHAVGPVWHGGKHDEEILLKSAIESTLEMAVKLGEKIENEELKRVCIPGISSAIFGFPIKLCAQIFGKTVLEFVDKMTE